jgi:hypothetical protein
VIERDLNPLENAHRRFGQLRSGGAWLNSPLRLLDTLLTAKDPNDCLMKLDEEDDELASVAYIKSEQFDSALKAVYGEIILAATQKFGADFVLRAGANKLTEHELSGCFISEELPRQNPVHSEVVNG